MDFSSPSGSRFAALFSPTEGAMTRLQPRVLDDDADLTI